MPLDLKARAERYTTPGGEATFYMLPYRTALASFTEQSYSRIKPEYLYVNDKTGEEVADEPKEYRRALTKAEAMKTTLKTDWRLVPQWDSMENLITGVEPLTVAVEFSETLSDEWQAFKDYWSVHTEGTVDERLALFRAIVAVDPYNEWWAAYKATRRNPAPASKELGEQQPSDPLVSSAGEPSDESMISELTT